MLPSRTEVNCWPRVSSVYPVATPFKSAVLTQSCWKGLFDLRKGVTYGKGGKSKLLKIPNFLHLTLVENQKHYTALKRFMHWVASSTKLVRQVSSIYFPVKTNYVSAKPSIQNPKARVVTLWNKPPNLNLDDHVKKTLSKFSFQESNTVRPQMCLQSKC